MPGARCTRGLVCKSCTKCAHEHTLLPARGKPPCEQTCAPTRAASTASHPAFVTTRDPPLLPGWDGADW